jgi:hypothetical protein
MLFALVSVASSAAFAASVTETFAGLSGNGTAVLTGTSSIPGFTLNTGGSAAPFSKVGNTEAFPGLANNVYFDTDGSVNDWPQFDGGTINTNANVVQVAVPLKVKSLGAAAANCSVDILTLDQTAGAYSPYFNFRASGGIFRTTDENGWPGVASPLSTTAFDPASPNNWRDADSGRWHLLVFKISPSTTAGAGAYTVWDINPSTGAATVVQTYTGATNGAVQATVNRFCAGLCIAGGAVSDTNTRILIDDITFWDDAFASDTAFLEAARAKYNVVSGVSDWQLF